MLTTGSYTPTSIMGTLSHLLATMTQLGKQVNRLEQRLVSLETLPPTTKAPSASPSAPAAPKPSRAKPTKKEKVKAPTTPATGVPAPQSICTTTLSKAVQEKTTTTLSITDDQAGHIVGRANSGLKQVHDISGAKVSVSPTVTAGFRLVTIRGTDRQVGDALTTIGKRLARRHLRSPKAAKKVKAPSSRNPTTAAPPPPIVTIVPPTPTKVPTPTPTTRSQPSSRPPSHSPSPMASSSSLPLSTPVDVHVLHASPMDEGAIVKGLEWRDHPPVASPQRGSRPTARRSHGRG